MRQLLLLIGTIVSLSAFSQARYDTIPILPEHYQVRLDRFKSEPVVTGKIMFAGNSITEGGNWKKLLKDSSVVNRGIGGDNTFGLLKRIDDIARRKPSSLFLLIGINDISQNIPDARILENILSFVSMIKSASPKTKVFVQSILPVNPSVKDFPQAYSKQTNIIEINFQLRKYKDVFKYDYIDIYSDFVDKGDMLNPKFTTDGLHLNPAGYIHWVEFLKKGGHL